MLVNNKSVHNEQTFSFSPYCKKDTIESTRQGAPEHYPYPSQAQQWICDHIYILYHTVKSKYASSSL